MTTTRRKSKPDMPISKEKVKDYISILEVSQKYSPKIRENTRRPLIICPFHPDKNLGACRIYTDTNTFKCESCGAHGDMLKLASGYLEEMTEGKYVRVWTPVDEDLLFVQQENGNVFSTEQLSMGTRELLYLAIRLALIEEYRQRNVRLPIILDDILVNFDRRRASAAARLLTKFAGDQTQIFFFTSHEHIREIFIQEDALICDMEKRK